MSKNYYVKTIMESDAENPYKGTGSTMTRQTSRIG